MWRDVIDPDDAAEYGPYRALAGLGSLRDERADEAAEEQARRRYEEEQMADLEGLCCDCCGEEFGQHGDGCPNAEPPRCEHPGCTSEAAGVARFPNLAGEAQYGAFCAAHLTTPVAARAVVS